MHAFHVILTIASQNIGQIWSITSATSNPGPFGIEAAREKALVISGHVTPRILDIFVTWPYYGYASTGGELIKVTEYIFKMSFKIHSTRHESG